MSQQSMATSPLVDVGLAHPFNDWVLFYFSTHHTSFFFTCMHYFSLVAPNASKKVFMMSTISFIHPLLDNKVRKDFG